MGDLLTALQAYLQAALVTAPPDPVTNPWGVTGVRIMGPYEALGAAFSVGGLPVVILTPVGEPARNPGPMAGMATVTWQIRIRCLMASTDPASLRVGPGSISALTDRIRLLLAQSKRLGQTTGFLSGTSVDTSTTDLDAISGVGKYVGRDMMQSWFRYETSDGAFNDQTTLALAG